MTGLFHAYCAFCCLQDDAAAYLSAALQHTIELLVSGALASPETTKLRSEMVTRVDMQPRHLQVPSEPEENMTSVGQFVQ